MEEFLVKSNGYIAWIELQFLVFCDLVLFSVSGYNTKVYGQIGKSFPNQTDVLEPESEY